MEATMPHQKITQALVDSLPYQDSGTFWVHDTELSGFNLSVGKQSKTYYAAGEHAGRFIRVKIGRSDVTKANEARAVARDVLLPEIRRGVDPRAKQLSDDDQTYARILAGVREARPEDLTDQMARRIMRGKATRRADELTVGHVWAMYEAHKRATILEEQGPEKARRAETHITQQRRYLGGAESYGKDGPYAATLEWPKGWWDRPITSITPELCSKTWRSLTRTRGRRSAQMFFNAVQVLFNYAVAKQEVPVTSHPMVIDVAGDGIGLPEGWATLKALNAVERISDIRVWWRQVDKMTVIPKSALKVALLTGMRPTEVLAMRWDQVDLEAGKVWFGMRIQNAKPIIVAPLTTSSVASMIPRSTAAACGKLKKTIRARMIDSAADRRKGQKIAVFRARKQNRSFAMPLTRNPAATTTVRAMIPPSGLRSSETPSHR
jgi:integrase